MPSRQLILLADKTISGVERSLNHQLRDAELSWTVRDAGFDSWLREMMNPESATRRETGAALGFLLSPRVLEMPEGARPQIDALLDVLERETPARTVLFSNLFADPLGVMPLARHADLMSAAADVNAKLYAFAKKHSWFHVVDHAGLATREGTRHLADPRFEATAQMYFSPAGSKQVANLWFRVLRALEKPAAKVLVVDLDNTLWGGILGEDGVEGIEMSAAAGGWAYRSLQQALLQLKANGVLLAVSSKNNPDEVQRVLAEHPDCLLRPGDFSAIEAGWGPKSQSLRRMAERLRLGLDSFVFLDDSAFEREEVKGALPQVTVIEFPEDPIGLVAALSETFAFDVPRITKEDRERASSYVAEAERDALREKATTPEEFYRSLGLQLKLFRAGGAHADRLHQLILKTNQFNLTTERVTGDEFRSFLERPDMLVVGMRVSDKFGDSGVTGLAIVQGIGSDTYVVDNFLLSCRVIGRTVENAFVTWLAERAAAANAGKVRFKFKSTARNGVAKDFLDRSGLSSTDDQQLWEVAVPPRPDALPAHFVTIDDREI